MDANELNEHYLSILNEKLLLEKNKEIILMGDFNINLLWYNEVHNSTDILDQIYFCSLVPCITFPARLTPWSKTPIDNIFSTDTANEVHGRKYFNDTIWSLSLIPSISNFYF